MLGGSQPRAGGSKLCEQTPNKHCRLAQTTAHQHSAQRPRAARERIENNEKDGDEKKAEMGSAFNNIVS